MPVYRIVDWYKIYENNRSRQIGDLRWVPLPNKHDSFGFRSLIGRPNGAALYGAWCLIVQVASKCSPRGSLIKNGVPLTPAIISFLTGCPETIIAECLEITQLPEIAWVTYSQHGDDGVTVKASRERHPGDVSERQSGDDARAEGRKEGSGRKEVEGRNSPPTPSPAQNGWAYLADETFTPFVDASFRFWGNLIVEEDLQSAWSFTWKKLDFEQKLAMTRSLLHRIDVGEDPEYVARPPKYIANGAWKKPPRLSRSNGKPLADQKSTYPDLPTYKPPKD